MPRKALLVTGMHRSATSTLMRICNQLGVRSPGTKMAPQQDNPLGFWEPAEIVAAHDALLNELDRPWNDARPLPQGWLTSAAAARCRARILEVVQRDCREIEIWGLKDPRLCRLLPLWLPIVESLGAKPYILHLFRNPDQVVASLRHRADAMGSRDGFTLSVSEPYQLWLTYVLEAERDSRAYPRAFISYDALLADWRSVLTGAANRMGFTWPNKPDEVAHDVDAYLNQGRRHMRGETTQEVAQSTAAQSARGLYKVLLTAAAGEDQQLRADFDGYSYVTDLAEKNNPVDFTNPSTVRTIAFYLPAYHPVPENDQWWGKGFTEWMNVVSSTPRFVGHYQPHLPTDLGFYDLRLPQVRAQQAEMAKQYGIYGFCYYYYWFNGKPLLEQPFQAVLNSGEPNFPFCLCWANESWTRTWDGSDNEVLISQTHSPEDDLAFIQSVIPAFRDPRYIRVGGRPLLLIYRPELLPDATATVARWREACEAAQVGSPYLCMVQGYGGMDPSPFGLDAAIEFPPHGYWNGEELPLPFKGWLHNFKEAVSDSLKRPTPEYTWFRGVMPSWDNSARRRDPRTKYHAFLGSSPDLYQEWLEGALKWTREHHSQEERMVFINSWNEWGEGSHLEPDIKYGHAWLEATLAAQRNDLKASKLESEIQQMLQSAITHIQTGRIQDAEALYRQVLILQPNNPYALHVLGLLKYQTGDTQRAIELLEQAIATKPDFAEACSNAATIYAELDQLENAIAKYKQALAVSPNLVEAHYNLAAIYQEQNRLDDAKKHYHEALTLKPDLVEARDKLLEISQAIGQG